MFKNNHKNFVRFFLIIFFVFFSKNSNAELLITEYKTSINFTSFGREVEVNIKAKVILNKTNYFYKEWFYIFDKRLKIDIIEAKVIGRDFRSYFNNNELKFQFKDAFNGDFVEFNFKYIQFDNKNTKYTRQEEVVIPEFAQKAFGTIVVKIPNDLATYSVNEKFQKTSNIFVWNGSVPTNGFRDIFLLTQKQAKWFVSINTKIEDDAEDFSEVNIVMPNFLKNGSNKIENYDIKINFPTEKYNIVETNDNNLTIKLDKIKGKFIDILLTGTVINDFDNKVWIKLDPYKQLNIDQNLSRELREVINEIQVLTKNDSSQLYIKLAKWVYNHMKYDLNYYAKNKTTIEILKEGRGVCEHYSQLYNDLLRAAGIPSVIISGMSYDNENQKFENHAWNMVYTNGDWVFIDPTWNLYSGKLPVSHVFFHFGGKSVVNSTIYNRKTDSNSKIELKSDVKPIY